MVYKHGDKVKLLQDCSPLKAGDVCVVLYACPQFAGSWYMVKCGSVQRAVPASCLENV
jgi:hypothetical protein